MSRATEGHRTEGRSSESRRSESDRPQPVGAASSSWHDTSDLLVAVIPLALTVLLLISGFTPILRTLSDPYTTWTGFSYQALLNKVMNYTLALEKGDSPASTLNRMHDQTLASFENTQEYADLVQVERIGPARLSRAAELFRAADRAPSERVRQARLTLAIHEAQMLNEQAHERIHEIQTLHSDQLERLRLVLLLAAALSGLLSAALIWRSLRLWRAERRRLEGQNELLSLASHELRRPLQALLLATDLLRGAQTPEDRLRYLGVVESSASQLASRANLEQLTEMYQGVQLDWQPVELDTLLLQFQGPRTEVQLPPERRQAGGHAGSLPLTAQADPARLRQIIENLHENALRYSAGTVYLGLSAQGDRPEIWVRDSGPGIDPGEVERLFLPRERGSAGQNAAVPDGGGHPGQGLGLTIARRLAQAHGADLSLQAAPGGGTLAVLRLRAASEPERRKQSRQS
ncbi:sensor histidine kinase [Deinococcus altitudinis]|uniref:sensor histidine kinase n=1 Tax=Deinococcus altitudinis TaxID=468914 RepID=UPI0038915FA4